jgi:predicted PolB exonuclease-like 3'-5' exonuclease
MKTCIFDIETAPLPETDIAMLAPKFEAPANFKDSVKIMANIQEQRQTWLERAALSPLTGSVAAIGVLSEDDQYIKLVGENGANERDVILFFWNHFRIYSERSTFVGFNIFRFDLPFLIRRSWKLGIAIPIGVREHRYFSTAFVDLMEIWQNGNREERISLDQLCKYLGVGAKSGNGADFYKLPIAQQREYLAHDLNLTSLVANKLLGVLEQPLFI